MRGWTMLLRLWMVCLGLLFHSPLFSGELPSPPDSCRDDIALQSFCSEMVAGNFTGPIELRFFLVVPKDGFANLEEAIGRFTDFKRWPEFAAKAEAEDIVFRKSEDLAAINKDGSEVLRQYADFKIAAPIVQWMDVRAVTHYYWTTAPEGAAMSLRFEAQTKGPQEVPVGAEPLEGAVGIKQQHGYFYGVDCSQHSLCEDNQYLLIYDSIVQAELDLLPKVAGSAIQGVIGNLMVGMYLR